MKKIDENNIIIKENKDKDKRNLQFSKAIMIYLFSSSFIFEYLKKKILLNKYEKFKSFFDKFFLNL